MTINNAVNNTLSGQTGTGAFVGANSPSLITPALGTPTSGVLTNCTGLPLGSITGLASGMATFLATPSSANLAATVTDETGTGSLVFGTSPTITTPKIITQINDTNGNAIISLSPQASAVNSIQISNSATTAALGLVAIGSDTNIIVSGAGKGTGRFQIKGTGSNNGVSTGYVGEFTSSVIPKASAVSLATTTPNDLTSISLTAGDYDVWGNVFFTIGGTCTANQAWISTTSATLPDPSLYCQFQGASLLSQGMCVPSIRISIASTTTVYISASAIFSTSTVTVCGGIYARRRS